MSDLRTAAQQALEALQWISDCHVGDDDDAGECASCHERSYKPHAPDCKKNNAITALRAALTQQDEPAQEPVAWNWMLDGLPYGRACYGDPPDADLAERAATAGRTVRLLYTAPPQRKPLTEEEIVDAVREADLDWQKGWTLDETQSNRFVTLARAVERAHGIKE